MGNQSDYRHREAYCLMKYATSDGKEVEWIWNSRDGVTPFVVRSKSGREMTHVQWMYDVRIKGYIPLEGERVFVDATHDLLRPRAEEMCKRHHPELGGENLEQMILNTLNQWCRSGNPTMITADEFLKIKS